MNRIRAMVESDIPRLVTLHQRVYGADKGPRWSSLAAHFDFIFFRHPWYDPDMPSLVGEDDTGRIVACLGVMPRPMRLHHERITCAITHNFMVDPGSRNSTMGVQLAREVANGPQDLSMAHGNDASRQIWRFFKGFESQLYSLCWVQPLQPVQYVLSSLQRRGLHRYICSGLRPVCRLADVTVSRLLHRSFEQPAGLTTAPLDAADIVRCFGLVTQRSLLPEYDEESFEWLLSTLSDRTDRGDLQRVRVERDGTTIGWYVYFANQGGLGHVLQMGAAGCCEEVVLSHLFAHARDRGVLAVAGHVDPQFFPALGRADAIFNHDGHTWVLVHSRRTEITDAVYQNKAFVSRLEGEWWINYIYGS